MALQPGGKLVGDGESGGRQQRLLQAVATMSIASAMRDRQALSLFQRAPVRLVDQPGTRPVNEPQGPLPRLLRAGARSSTTAPRSTPETSMG